MYLSIWFTNGKRRETDGLRDVVDYHGAVGVAIVHGRQGLVTFLASGIPGGRRNGLDDRPYGRKEGGKEGRKGGGGRWAPKNWGYRAAGDPHQISNLIVVVSSRAMVCVRNAAPIVDSR